jgi:hypothetical protein
VLVNELRRAHLRTAVVSASRTCGQVHSAPGSPTCSTHVVAAASTPSSGQTHSPSVNRSPPSRAIDEPIAIDEVTAEQARDFYTRQGGFAAANADFLFGFESYDGVEGATDEPHDTSVGLDETYLTLTQITGRPGDETDA